MGRLPEGALFWVGLIGGLSMGDSIVVIRWKPDGWDSPRGFMVFELAFNVGDTNAIAVVGLVFRASGGL